MCFREGINPNPFGDLGAYCGGSRLAEGFGGCFRKKLAESWFIAFSVGVIGEGLGGFNQGCCKGLLGSMCQKC